MKKLIALLCFLTFLHPAKGAPDWALEPQEVSVSSESDSRVEIPLKITNSGDEELVWAIDHVDFGAGEAVSTEDLSGMRIGLYAGDDLGAIARYERLLGNLREHQATVVTLDAPLSKAELNEVDVLILREPDAGDGGYDPAVVAGWVKSGGGLFLEISSEGAGVSLLEMTSSSMEITSGSQSGNATFEPANHPVNGSQTDRVPLGHEEHASLRTRIPARPIASFGSDQTPLAAEVLGGGRIIATTYRGFLSSQLPESLDPITQQTALRAMGWLARARGCWLEDPTGLEGRLAPGESSTQSLSIDPSKVPGGSYTANICLVSNAPGSIKRSVPITFTLAGTPNLRVEQIPAFGSAVAGSSVTRSVTVSNPGAEAVTVSSIQISPPFSFTGELPITIPGRSSRSFPLVFSPTTTGLSTVNLVLSTEELGDPPAVVAVSATGIPAPSVSVSQSSFDEAVALGTGEFTRRITLTNTGATNLHWDAASFHPYEIQPAEIFGQAPSDALPSLRAVQNRLQSASESITAPLENLFLFSGGSHGSSLGSEDGRVYASSAAQIRGLNATTRYTNGSVVKLTDDDEEMEYFTQVEPGIFYCAADLKNIEEFGLSTTPHSAARARVFTQIFNGSFANCGYRMILQQIAGSAVPSTNSILIIPETTGSGQPPQGLSFSTYVAFENLPEIQRVYALFFVGKAGFFYSESSVRGLVENFLNATTPGWLTLDRSGSIAPGQSSTFEFTVDASQLTGGEHTAFVRITTNDPITPIIDVPIVVEIDVAPSLPFTNLGASGLDFGDVVRGTSQTATVSLTNPGNGLVEVTGLRSDSVEFSGSPSGRIPPGASRNFDVVFSPTNFVESEATVFFETTGGDVQLEASGIGVVGEPVAFVWDTLPQSTRINSPLSAGITAVDQGGNRATSFVGSATLYATSPAPSSLLRVPDTSSPLVDIGDPFRTRSANQFTTDVDITITALQSLGGSTNFSVLDAEKNVLEEAPVSFLLLPEGWRQYTLERPVEILAGSTFYVVARSNTEIAFARQTVFPHGEIGPALSDSVSGEDLLDDTSEDITYPLGFVYAVGDASSIEISPTSTGGFVEGRWEGELTPHTSIGNFGFAAFGNLESGFSASSTPVVEGTITLDIPSDFTEGSAVSGSGRLILSNPASSDLEVFLIKSSDELQIPAMLRIPSGSSAISFDISVPQNSNIDRSRKVDVIARAAGYSDASSEIVIVDDEALSVSFSAPSFVDEGRGFSVEATFSDFPSNDIYLTGSSTTPGVVASQGRRAFRLSKTATLFFSNPSDRFIDGDREIEIEVSAPGFPVFRKTVKVVEDDTKDLVLRRSFSSPVYESQILTHRMSIEIVGAEREKDSLVYLESSVPEISVPKFIIIPAGQRSARFLIQILDEAEANGTRELTITARRADGATPPVMDRIIIVDENTPTLSISTYRLFGEPMRFNVTIGAYLSDQERDTTLSGEVRLEGVAYDGSSISVTPARVPIEFDPLDGFSGWQGQITVMDRARLMRLRATVVGSQTTGISDPFTAGIFFDDSNVNWLPDSWEGSHAVRLGEDLNSDPDGDNIPHLLEYFLGTDPNVAEFGEFIDISEDRSTFSFEARIEPTGAEMLPQVSSDLESWETLSESSETSTAERSGFERRTFSFPDHMQGHRFIRLLGQP